jgi:hypothetical protein
MKESVQAAFVGCGLSFYAVVVYFNDPDFLSKLAFKTFVYQNLSTQQNSKKVCNMIIMKIQLHLQNRFNPIVSLEAKLCVNEKNSEISLD